LNSRTVRVELIRLLKTAATDTADRLIKEDPCRAKIEIGELINILSSKLEEANNRSIEREALACKDPNCVHHHLDEVQRQIKLAEPQINREIQIWAAQLGL
jgi:hypothetical protein